MTNIEVKCLWKKLSTDSDYIAAELDYFDGEDKYRLSIDTFYLYATSDWAAKHIIRVLNDLLIWLTQEGFSENDNEYTTAELIYSPFEEVKSLNHLYVILKIYISGLCAVYGNA